MIGLNRNMQVLQYVCVLSALQSSLSISDVDSPTAEDRKDKDRGKEEPEPRSVEVSLRRTVPAVRPPSLQCSLRPVEGTTASDFTFLLCVDMKQCFLSFTDEMKPKPWFDSSQAPDSKAPLPAKPSVLTPPNSALRPSSPSSSSGLTPSPEQRHSPVTPPSLEDLRSQLRDLRASVELLKSQHRYSTHT